MSRRKARSNSASRRPRRQVKRLVEGQIMTLDDRRIPLIYQRNTRARRIILRFDQSAGRIVVVLPPRATYDEGRRFAQTHRSWIRERVELLPEGVPFETGKVVPFLGQPHRIRHRPKARGVVWCEEGEIHVAGKPEHLPRRVEDWLKLEARRERRAGRAAPPRPSSPSPGVSCWRPNGCSNMWSHMKWRTYAR